MKAKTRNAVAAAAVLLALCALPFLAGKFTIYLAMRIMLLGIFAVGTTSSSGRRGSSPSGTERSTPPAPTGWGFSGSTSRRTPFSG